MSERGEAMEMAQDRYDDLLDKFKAEQTRVAALEAALRRLVEAAEALTMPFEPLPGSAIADALATARVSLAERDGWSQA